MRYYRITVDDFSRQSRDGSRRACNSVPQTGDTGTHGPRPTAGVWAPVDAAASTTWVVETGAATPLAGRPYDDSQTRTRQPGPGRRDAHQTRGGTRDDSPRARRHALDSTDRSETPASDGRRSRYRAG